MQPGGRSNEARPVAFPRPYTHAVMRACYRTARRQRSGGGQLDTFFNRLHFLEHAGSVKAKCDQSRVGRQFEHVRRAAPWLAGGEEIARRSGARCGWHVRL